MLELRSLPDNVDMFVCDLSFDSQKVEKNVRLFDHFNVKIRTKNMIDNSTVEKPIGQLETDVFNFDDGVGVAHLIEQRYVGVNLKLATNYNLKTSLKTFSLLSFRTDLFNIGFFDLSFNF